jgi:glycerophosphoryl diester phosphodiesterase
MRPRSIPLKLAAGFSVFFATATVPAFADRPVDAQLGPRPFYLVEQMKDSKLKNELNECSEGPFQTTDFSIGHRGAALQFPEHTKESYEAAARMGAGIVECDVTFTGDGALVCRHSQCDLHTTTDILKYTDLNNRCTQPFEPAEYDEDGNLIKRASAQCCTSDITLQQFKQLKGKMDASNPYAVTVEEYMEGTANWRTDLYATTGTLLSHAESIDLIRSLGAKFTPELKGGNADDIQDVFGSQEAYAQKMIDEYLVADVPPQDVWPQSFNLEDVLYWIDNTNYGEQAVFLDERDPREMVANPPKIRDFKDLKAKGVNIIAPPMPTLLQVRNGKIKPSKYAKRARKAGLDIITWTLERSGRIAEDVLPTKDTAAPSYYYQTTLDALQNDGDIMVTLDVLAQKVGIIGIFSDWPATVTYYANCKGL